VEAKKENLEPLPYHLALRDYLKANERELWDWFASGRAQADYTESLRLHLLKSTYRLNADNHPDLCRLVEEAKAGLQLDIPVTIYQAQSSPEPNSVLYFIPGEGHVVFSGPVLSLLTPEEIKAVLGHELAHYLLWQWDQGELHVADRLIQAFACDPRATASHQQSARHFQLYTEIFADRGSLRVTGDVNPAISGLVKIQTGLGNVSAPAYRAQAEEIFSKENLSTEGLSHPEAFIRARALSLWQDQGKEAHPLITKMIEGAETLHTLDLIGQARMMKNTRQLLEVFLQPRWFQTPAVLGHATLFFHDFKPATIKAPSLLQELRTGDSQTGEYLCYVLLDFVTADPELEDMPLAAALVLSRELELDTQFEKIVVRELKRKLRDVRKLKEEAPEMLGKAEVAE
jgi:hypothetical protein